jgi:hypothetical protein
VGFEEAIMSKKQPAAPRSPVVPATVEAIQSWRKTARYCLIRTVAAVPGVVTAWIVAHGR